jgi:hypothetical protein
MLYKIHGVSCHKQTDGNHQQEYERPGRSSPVAEIDNAKLGLESGLNHSAGSIWHKYPTVFFAKIKLKHSVAPVARISPFLQIDLILCHTRSSA